jgi:ABC-type enterochelin transport system ATPase subunit
MKKRTKILSLCVVLLICFSSLFLIVQQNYYLLHEEAKIVNGIIVSRDLIFYTIDMNIDYCKLLKKALKGDANSIKKLTLLNIEGASSAYDHGNVIIGLIEHLGEDKFINSLGTINYKQTRKIISYLRGGFEYGQYPYLQGKSIKEIYPKIHGALELYDDD